MKSRFPAFLMICALISVLGFWVNHAPKTSAKAKQQVENSVSTKPHGPHSSQIISNWHTVSKFESDSTTKFVLNPDLIAVHLPILADKYQAVCAVEQQLQNFDYGSLTDSFHPYPLVDPEQLSKCKRRVGQVYVSALLTAARCNLVVNSGKFAGYDQLSFASAAQVVKHESQAYCEIELMDQMLKEGLKKRVRSYKLGRYTGPANGVTPEADILAWVQCLGGEPSTFGLSNQDITVMKRIADGKAPSKYVLRSS